MLTHCEAMALDAVAPIDRDPPPPQPRDNPHPSDNVTPADAESRVMTEIGRAIVHLERAGKWLAVSLQTQRHDRLREVVEQLDQTRETPAQPDPTE